MDCLPLRSKSLPRSKTLIASTLLGSPRISNVRTLTVVEPYEIFDFDVDSIIVSEKFFNPAGWIMLLTGEDCSSQGIGLLTE